VAKAVNRSHQALQVWKASLLLADWVIQNRHLFQGGTRVLELGAGVGLPSIVAASMGASCMMTDVDADALQLAQRNIQANQTYVSARGGRVMTRVLDWDSPVGCVDEDGKAVHVAGLQQSSVNRLTCPPHAATGVRDTTHSHVQPAGEVASGVITRVGQDFCGPSGLTGEEEVGPQRGSADGLFELDTTGHASTGLQPLRSPAELDNDLSADVGADVAAVSPPEWMELLASQVSS
jgi:hypothetical protein